MNLSQTNLLRLAAVILIGSASSILAQTTVTTDPVGFITLNSGGNGGGAEPSFSFRSLGMTRAVEYQGSAESVGTNTLVDNEATWTDNQFNGAAGAHFVEIISGPRAGTTYDIQTTAAASKTLTLTQNLGSGITAPVSFKVRKHWTIATVFGANNEGGLTGGTSTTADQIMVQNGASFDSYYFQTSGGGGIGWRKSGVPDVDASGTVLFPEEGMIIKRTQSAAANVVLLGAVKTGQTSVPIVQGNNLIGNVYAANLTLASSNLYTGDPGTGVAGGAQGDADEVLIYNETTKNYVTHYYKIGGLGGNGWRNANDGSDATSASIPVGSSIIVRRKGATGFNWVVPQHPPSL